MSTSPSIPQTRNPVASPLAGERPSATPTGSTMKDSLDQLDRLSDADTRVAMATLVATRGTSPRREGAKMWVSDRGAIVGSVTIGGCVDARVIQASDDALRSNAPALLTVELGDEDAQEMGLTCAGAVDVLVEPMALDDPADPVRKLYARVRAYAAAGGRAVLITPLRPGGGKLAMFDDGRLLGELTLPDPERVMREGRSLLRRGTPRTLELPVGGGEIARIYFEVHAPPLNLVVFGAGHVAQALVRFAHGLGMRTTVVDARDRYANPGAFPEADEIRVAIPSEVAAEVLPLGRSLAAVLVAHDYKYDLPVLRELVRGDAAYVGMLGSRRRGQAMMSMLAEEGIPPEQLEQVHTPVGLDIGAESAAELAISILAEILAERSGRPGGSMRLRGTT